MKKHTFYPATFSCQTLADGQTFHLLPAGPTAAALRAPFTDVMHLSLQTQCGGKYFPHPWPDVATFFHDGDLGGGRNVEQGVLLSRLFFLSQSPVGQTSDGIQ